MFTYIRPYEVRFVDAFLAFLAKNDLDYFLIYKSNFNEALYEAFKCFKTHKTIVDKYQIGWLGQSNQCCLDYHKFIGIVKENIDRRISVEMWQGKAIYHLRITDNAADYILKELPEELVKLAETFTKAFLETYQS